jgi:hypothetical protein
VGSVRSRRLLAQGLVVVASAVLLLALVAAYARHALVDSDQFANRATEALRADSVKTLIAERITDQVVLKNNRDLIAARPIIESVTGDVVTSPAFTALFRSGVRDVHRALFLRDQDTLTLTVADVGTVLAAALQHVRPELADELERTGGVSVISGDIGSVSATAARIADDIKLLALLLLVLGVALVGAAIAVAPDRRGAVVGLGVGAACAGVLLVVALGIARSIAVNRLEDPDEQAARARGLGRVPGRPAQRGLDPGDLGRDRRGRRRIAAPAGRARRADAARRRVGDRRAADARPASAARRRPRGDRPARPARPRRRAAAADDRARRLPRI